MSDGPDHLGGLLKQVGFLGFPALGHRAALVIGDQQLFWFGMGPKRRTLLHLLEIHSGTTDQWLPCRLLPLIPRIISGCNCLLMPLL